MMCMQTLASLVALIGLQPASVQMRICAWLCLFLSSGDGKEAVEIKSSRSFCYTAIPAECSVCVHSGWWLLLRSHRSITSEDAGCGGDEGVVFWHREAKGPPKAFSTASPLPPKPRMLTAQSYNESFQTAGEARKPCVPFPLLLTLYTLLSPPVPSSTRASTACPLVLSEQPVRR